MATMTSWQVAVDITTSSKIDLITTCRGNTAYVAVDQHPLTSLDIPRTCSRITACADHPAPSRPALSEGDLDGGWSSQFPSCYAWRRPSIAERRKRAASPHLTSAA